MSKASIGVGLVLFLTVIAQAPAPAYAQNEELLISTLGFSGTVLFDIVTAPVSAARYNEKQAHLSPTMNLRDGSLGLAMRFSFNRARPLRAGYVNGYTPPVLAYTRQAKRKSPFGVMMLSLGATAAPLVLGAEFGVNEDLGAFLLITTGSVVFGPSVGHWYAEQNERGWLTAGLRMLLVAVLLGSFFNGYS